MFLSVLIRGHLWLILLLLYLLLRVSVPLWFSCLYSLTSLPNILKFLRAFPTLLRIDCAGYQHLLVLASALGIGGSGNPLPSIKPKCQFIILSDCIDFRHSLHCKNFSASADSDCDVWKPNVYSCLRQRIPKEEALALNLLLARCMNLVNNSTNKLFNKEVTK